MAGERVLVVDDEADMVGNLVRGLRHAGYRCLHASEGRRAAALLESERPDAVVTDLRMPEGDGIALIDRARALDPPVPVIVVTAFATIASAVETIKRGAFDYLAKPFTMDQLVVTVERAVHHRRLAVENVNLRAQLGELRGIEPIIGRSPAMTQVLELVRKAARAEANTLVVGESGTGKELIAHALHANSPRAARPLVPVDCASLPEPLLESELFGHEKGAFTGAIRTKPGLLEVADGGTLFLDEIAELPPTLQAKLLRALQEHEIRRVGGTEMIPVDVRVISATSRDLRRAIADGTFRAELFYRVDVIEIRVPPLRDRAGDVPLLVQEFLKRYGQARVRRIDDDALAVLKAHRWPGNVRELQNVIERACTLAESDTITRADLPDTVRERVTLDVGPSDEHVPLDPRLDASASVPLGRARERWLDALEGAYLRDQLARHHGNVSAAAHAAGIDRKTFHRLMKKHRVRPSRSGGGEGASTAA